MHLRQSDIGKVRSVISEGSDGGNQNAALCTAHSQMGTGGRWEIGEGGCACFFFFFFFFFFLERVGLSATNEKALEVAAVTG